MDYRIEKKEAFTAIVKAKTFGESSTGEISAFWSEYFAGGLAAKVPPMMGICGEKISEEGDFKYGIGCPEQNVATTTYHRILRYD